MVLFTCSISGVVVVAIAYVYFEYFLDTPTVPFQKAFEEEEEEG